MRAETYARVSQATRHFIEQKEGAKYLAVKH